MELPEVEVMRRDLEKEVVGRRIARAEVRPHRNAMRVVRRHARRKEVTDRLADQKFISGLGNIYSDEVLFAAGLRYDRSSETLSSQEVRRLYRAIREVVQDAIRFRGTTLEDEAYVDLFGKPGEFQSELKVYGRKGLPCRRCRTPIDAIKIGGRNSYFCPQCQS